jgi:hypothetical protein
MGTMRLRDALEQFEGQVLTDGAQDWDQDNLCEVIGQNEDPDEARELGYVLLDDPVYVDETGIRRIRGDGFLGDYLYTVKTDGQTP